MEIIDKCRSRWNRCLNCVGGVHTDFGCGSRIAVEVSDLFYVLDCQKRRPERMVAFQCPLCGLGTVVAREGSKDWTTWFDNLHKRNPLLEDDSHGAEAMSGETPCISQCAGQDPARPRVLLPPPKLAGGQGGGARGAGAEAGHAGLRRQGAGGGDRAGGADPHQGPRDPLSSTASPACERVHTALHVLWSKSVGSQDYVKREWTELETAICALAQEADRRLLAARGGETPTGKKTA